MPNVPDPVAIPSLGGSRFAALAAWYERWLTSDALAVLLKAVALQYVAEAAHRYVSREAMHCYCT